MSKDFWAQIFRLTATRVGAGGEAGASGGDIQVKVIALFKRARCLIPDFDGAIFSLEWKEALWDRFYTAAPPRQRQSVEQYRIVKRA